MGHVYTRKAAYLSPAGGGFRYTLTRAWEREFEYPRMVVIGLNPSTADADNDDPTIRRCVGFAKREGCRSLVMLNVFAWRATDPAQLLRCADPVGAENDGVLQAHATSPETILVAAWGSNIRDWTERERRVMAILRNATLMCFGVTKDGHPRHPLYVRGDTPLIPFPGR